MRDWVPVSSILSRLTSSTAFGASLARATTSSSAIFQVLPLPLNINIPSKSLLDSYSWW